MIIYKDIHTNIVIWDIPNIKYKKFDLRIIAKFQDNILKLTKKIINKI